MNVHQFLTSYSYGDAIGNEALEIRDFLRAQGIGSEIFTMHFHPRYAHQVRNYLDYDRFSAPGNTVIYHFSIGSPVTKKFLRLADRKVIIYHNITPYHFFLDYHRILAKDCFKGRLELKSLAGQVDLALGDSEYNRRELVEAGFRADRRPAAGHGFFQVRPAGAAGIPRAVRRRQDQPALYRPHHPQQEDRGRHPRLSPLTSAISTPTSRLFLVGEYRGFERYVSALQGLVAALGVRDVHFSGHVPLAEVVSYAKLSHLYLHLSEHEGFCAPVVESFHLGIPVVAFDAGAVAETMNGGGVLVREKDPLRMAALCHEILTRPATAAPPSWPARQRALEKYRQQRTRQDPARLTCARSRAAHERP